MSGFATVKSYVDELGLDVVTEVADEELLVLQDDERGIHNLIVDCEDDLLIFEQSIFQLSRDDPATFKRLLQMNRELVHGAFVLDEAGERVLFRDTLQLKNLDLNEFEGTINALSLGLAMFSDELIGFARS